MSPHVGNFVADLVEMAKATERLPQVEAELAEVKAHAVDLAQTVQNRELRIMALNDEIAALQTQLRNAEVSRDDAELRFLEADDKLARVLNLVRGMGETLGQVIVTAEPERQPEPVVYQAPPSNWGQSAADPTANSTSDHSVPSVQTPDTATISTIQTDPAPEVAAPTDPTVSSVTGDGPSPDSAAAMTNAETPADATSQEQSSTAPGEGDFPIHPQPYAGKNWSELPLDERPYTKEHWLSGGGSVEGWIS